MLNTEDIKVGVWIHTVSGRYGQIIEVIHNPSAYAKVSFNVQWLDLYISSGYWDVDLKYFRLLTETEKLELL